MSRAIRRLAREPLLHFLLLGAALFGLDAWLGDGEPAEVRPVIEVTTADQQRLSDIWLRLWGRRPTPDELAGLINDHIREEVLYREALAMGLDRDDTIIRRRLAQKLSFLSEDLAELETPDEAAVIAYYEQHREAFLRPPRLSFEHVYINVDRRGTSAEPDALTALAALQSADGNAGEALSWLDLGDPFMLERRYEDLTAPEIDRLFGRAFGTTIATLPAGQWQGPIVSGYGIHLVRVTDFIEGGVPSLADIRDDVQREVANARRRDMNERFYESLRARYDIIVASTESTGPGPPDDPEDRAPGGDS